MAKGSNIVYCYYYTSILTSGPPYLEVWSINSMISFFGGYPSQKIGFFLSSSSVWAFSSNWQDVRNVSLLNQMILFMEEKWKKDFWQRVKPLKNLSHYYINLVPTKRRVDEGRRSRLSIIRDFLWSRGSVLYICVWYRGYIGCGELGIDTLTSFWGWLTELDVTKGLTILADVFRGVQGKKWKEKKKKKLSSQL